MAAKPNFKTSLPSQPRKVVKKNPKIPDLVKIVGDDDDTVGGELEISRELNLDLSNTETQQYVRCGHSQDKVRLSGH